LIFINLANPLIQITIDHIHLDVAIPHQRPRKGLHQYLLVLMYFFHGHSSLLFFKISLCNFLLWNNNFDPWKTDCNHEEKYNISSGFKTFRVQPLPVYFSNYQVDPE